MNAEQRENNWACGHKSYACCGRCADDLESKVAYFTAQLSEARKKSLPSSGCEHEDWVINAPSCVHCTLRLEILSKKAIGASLEEAQREREKAEEYGVKASKRINDLLETQQKTLIDWASQERRIKELTALLESSKVREKGLREALEEISVMRPEYFATNPPVYFYQKKAKEALAEGKGEA